MTDTPPRSPRNEAAERLLALVTSGATPGYYGMVADEIDAALAEERRHGVKACIDHGHYLTLKDFDDLSVDSSTRTPEQPLPDWAITDPAEREAAWKARLSTPEHETVVREVEPMVLTPEQDR